MGDRLPFVANEETEVSGDERGWSTYADRPPSASIRYGTTRSNTNTEMTNNTSNVHQYEELMAGSVPCPSCRGSGRIPKELERELVALIPLSDKRLKPRRTYLWVLLGVLAALLICGFVLFFLIPRSMSISNNGQAIEEVNVVQFVKNYELVLNFFNYLNVSNNNYYSVRVSNASANVINQFQPWLTELIGKGTNTTGMTLPLRSKHNTLALNTTVKLTGHSLEYCSGFISKFVSVYILMQFDMTVTFQYMGHREQETITTYQQICCVPSGNCTSEAF